MLVHKYRAEFYKSFTWYFVKKIYLYFMSIAAKYRPYYTYDEYCLWEGKWELIEGMPYAMCPAPVPAHQNVNGNIYSELKAAVILGCNKCKVYLPLDWKISEDTVVQPDVLVVCKKIEKKFLDFPPVLVVEILSPSTGSKDRHEKMELYLSQKVKYYLIIDPQFKKVEVYELIHDQYLPVALNPATFIFSLHADCIAEVNLLDIWD
jgi:Uma2 family endonuclease